MNATPSSGASQAASGSSNPVGDMIASLLTAPVQVAAALAGTLSKNMGAATSAATSLASAANSFTSSGCGPSIGFGALASSCEIPPPCWEPQPVGRCCLQVAPGGTATIRVHVSNCGWTRQVIQLTSVGRIAALMSFAPTAYILGPQERANFRVTIHVPANARVAASLTGPLLIRGCRDHFARVEVTVADCVTGNCNCCDITVNDCADQVHHWYDHFYCPRPCHTLREPVNPPVKTRG
ncbi:MAG: hypothetical protein U0132_04325 [Gemmatimonadaceae bacterium]